MTDIDRPDNYSAIGRSLHWLVAILVIAALVVGEIMTDLALLDPNKFWLYQLHKSLGFTVLGLMALRIVWRVTHRTPGLPAGMPGYQRWAATATHLAFYALLILMPLGGWAIVSVSPLPIPTVLWGVVPIPHLPFLADLSAIDKPAWSSLFMTMHALGGKLVIALLALHIVAALYHQFWVRDGLMARMVPGLRVIAVAFVAGLGGAALTGVPPCFAGDAPVWTVDVANSSVKFQATVSGQAVSGAIKSFAATIKFDPADPASTDIGVELDMASVSAGAAQADAMLQTADWFDVAAQPKAVFRARSARKTAENAFELAGELTLKGVTLPVVLPFVLDVAGATAKATGSVTIDRNAFGVGRGDAAAAVAPEVQISIALTAAKSG